MQCCRIQILPCFLHQSSVADPEPDPEVPSILIGCSELLASSVADPDPYFLGLLDPDPDPLVRGMDPDPDSSITKEK